MIAIKVSNQKVKCYSKALGEVIKEQDSFAFSNGKYHNLTRAVGIVVDKLKATTEQGIDMPLPTARLLITLCR